MSVHSEVKRVTTHVLQSMKEKGEKIAMLTAYDFSMARILDEAGVDVLLVGDSASNVMAGHETTLPITLDQMIYHASSVVRAVKRSLVVVDLPFWFLSRNSKLALESTIRIMKESGDTQLSWKEEKKFRNPSKGFCLLSAGHGRPWIDPQSIYKFGTYTVRAKEEAEAEKLLKDAALLQELGCFALVLEKIPAKLTKQVSEMLEIPTIGIGGGNSADGQVLVTHDMLGITKDFKPRFLRRYLELFDAIKDAAERYIQDVRDRDFPNDKEQY
ncbi:MAG: 3-methyl-2-oxobutanoate hydroxymethyltransferase [Saprospiraceae bacterium]